MMKIVICNKKMMQLLYMPSLKLSASEQKNIMEEVDAFFDCINDDMLRQCNQNEELYELFFSKRNMHLCCVKYLKGILAALDSKCKVLSSTFQFWAVISIQYGPCANITAKIFSTGFSVEDYSVDDYRQPTLIAVFGRDS